MTSDLVSPVPVLAAVESVLVADFGRRSSRLFLLERVDESCRLVAIAEEPTPAPGTETPGASWLRLLAHLEDLTGRQLTHDGELLIPQSAKGDGVDALGICSTLAPPVRVAVLECGDSPIADPLVQALRHVHTSVMHLVAPSERGQKDWEVGHLPIIEGFQPEMVIVLVGENARHGITRIINLAEQPLFPRSAARVVVVAEGIVEEKISAAFNQHARVRAIWPSECPSEEIVTSIAREIATAFHVRGVSPDLERALDESAASVLPHSHAVDLVNRFLAARYRRSALTLSIEDGTHAHWAFGELGVMASLPRLDLHQGLADLTTDDIAEAVRWLPFSASEDDLIAWIARKLEEAPPMRGGDDARIEQALVRIIARRVLGDLLYAHPQVFDNIDLLVAGPTFGRWQDPVAAALTLIDCLPALPEDPVIDLAIDRDGLMAVAGTVGVIDPELSATVFAFDTLHRLGAVIPVRGHGRDGEPAAFGEVHFANGEWKGFTVPHGGLCRVPVPPGQSATVVIFPDAWHGIGNNPPGEGIVLTGPEAITGGSVGLILDARSHSQRPSPARVSAWLAALAVP